MAQPARQPRGYEAIQAIADRLAPKVRREFLAAVKALQGRISVGELARAAERGRLTVQITQAIDRWPAELRNAVAVVNDVFAKSGAAAAAQLSGGLRISTSFDLTNPFALEAARNRTAFLVREITRSTREALQGVIHRAIRDGIAPREAARLIRPLVGLTSRQALSVMDFRRELVEQGLSGDAVRKAAGRYAARLHRARALNIARTETIRASVDGQLALWQQAKADGLLGDTTVKRWTVTPDDRLCPRCRKYNGLEVPLDAVFQVFGDAAVMGPPLHPQCRCALVLSKGSKRAAA